MLCGCEGNHRSDITLAMRQRLSGLSTYGLNGQCAHCAGDEHHTYAPLENGPLYLSYLLSNSQLLLTSTGKTISDVSWITFTPVAAGRVTGTHVRCYLSTGGVCMTNTRCTRCTLPRICIFICTHSRKVPLSLT